MVLVLVYGFHLLVPVVWCYSQLKSRARDTYVHVHIFKIYIYHLDPIDSSIPMLVVPSPFLNFIPCPLFLLFPFLALPSIISPLLTPLSPLSLTGGTWSTISKIPTASFGTSGNLTGGGGSGTGTGGSNTGNGNGTSGQITKPNTSGATTATTKAATVVLGLVGVGMAVLGVLV